MAEATDSVQLAKIRSSMGMATRALALRAATNATKRGLSAQVDRKSTRLNSSHVVTSRMPSSA